MKVKIKSCASFSEFVRRPFPWELVRLANNTYIKHIDILLASSVLNVN